MPTLAGDQARNLLAEEKWRYRIHDYAHVISGGKWIPYHHLQHTLLKVEAAIKRGNARIVVSEPPRHGKSEGISHYLPTWYLDWMPHHRVVLASYGDDFAAEWGLKVRDNFQQNPLTWTNIRKDKEKASNWLTTEGGGMSCVGVGGTIVGKGGNLIVVDDPHKNWEEAMSASKRRRVQEFFTGTLYNRMEPNASIVVVQTRWHEDDLIGYLLNEHEDDWINIRLPAIAEDDPDDPDPLGRRPGEALCPQRYTAETLEKMHRGMPEQVWAGLYQQRPAPAEGNKIKRSQIKRYTKLPDDLREWKLSWDFSAGSKQRGSYNAGQVWARHRGDFYLIDQFHARAELNEAKAAFLNQVRAYPEAKRRLVEQAANGKQIIDALKRDVPGIIPVPVNNAARKEVRLEVISSYFESGNVYLPEKAVAKFNVELLIEELVAFPNSRYSDQVDALSQALDDYGNGVVTGFEMDLEFGKQENPWRIR